MDDRTVHVNEEDVPWLHDPDDEGAPARIRTRTLISADRTPTRGVTMGVFELPPGAADEPHRHEPAEVYYVTDGEAEVFLEGEWRSLRRGDVVYVPGDVVHGTRNLGDQTCTIVWIFPTDSYGSIEYLPSEGR